MVIGGFAILTSASGFDYARAASEMAVLRVGDVPIPFASPRLLWRMKRGSVRDKDAPDVHFLRLLMERSGEVED